MPSLETIDRAAARSGLAPRGSLSLDPSERLGALADVRALVLLGMIGGSNWPAFAASLEFADGAPHPLDRWSRRTIGALADALGGVALYPFDGPPYWPFQRWAQRADSVWPSPLGLLIHAEYGLWHSYRGALAFAEDIFAPTRAASVSPCETCPDKPCLSACPVAAFSGQGYEVDVCAGHLRSQEGDECFSLGCLARRACPIGPEYAQGEAQSRFAMRAFLAGREPPTGPREGRESSSFTKS
jgi:hypothetical protein